MKLYCSFYFLYGNISFIKRINRGGILQYHVCFYLWKERFLPFQHNYNSHSPLLAKLNNSRAENSQHWIQTPIRALACYSAVVEADYRFFFLDGMCRKEANIDGNISNAIIDGSNKSEEIHFGILWISFDTKLDWKATVLSFWQQAKKIFAEHFLGKQYQKDIRVKLPIHSL